MSCKEVFNDTKRQQIGVGCRLWRASWWKRKFVCGLLLSPAETAKQAINITNPILITRCSHIKHMSCRLELAGQPAEHDLKFANAY